jgi:hypothetical protein
VTEKDALHLFPVSCFLFSVKRPRLERAEIRMPESNSEASSVSGKEGSRIPMVLNTSG